jgi:hypothetical protein
MECKLIAKCRVCIVKNNLFLQTHNFLPTLFNHTPKKPRACENAALLAQSIFNTHETRNQ